MRYSHSNGVIKETKVKKRRLFLVVVFVVFSVITVFLLNSTALNQQRQLDARVKIVVGLLKEYGYGGLIHNFKNYLLRNRILDYNKAVANYVQIQELLSSYRELERTGKENKLISNIEENVAMYRRNLDFIKDARSMSETSAEVLDKRVKIDDQDALAGISSILVVLNSEVRNIESSTELRSVLTYSSVILFIAVLGFFYFREISTVEAANQRLELANEELSQFSYRTSHDLKAPLSSIRGLCEVASLDLEEGDHEEVKKVIERIDSQAEKLSKLVIDILSIAQTEAMANQSNDIIDLQGLLDEVRESNLQVLSERNVSLSMEVDYIGPFVSSRARVYQVLSNLVSNGAKYSSSEQTESFIHLSIKKESQGVRLVVEDNGVGFPKDSHQTAFSMFSRFHPQSAEGSGLGLHIVKKNVDSLGGTVELTSSSKGSKFNIYLPNREAS